MARTTAETAPRTRREREPRPRRIIVYAGTSERRNAFANAANEAAGKGLKGDYMNIPAGNEPDINDTVQIMLRKVMVADQAVGEQKLARPQDTVIILAADIRTRIGPSKINKGKPKSPEEVRRTFQRMSREEHPYYTVESGSGVRINKNYPLVTSDTTTVLLDQEAVKFFSTPDGFDVYHKSFRDYYASSVYVNGGQHEPIDVTDLAAGLSLPVLLANHAVLEINGIASNDPDFREAVKMAIYNVGIGFDPGLLKNIWPDIRQFIAIYPWLEKATAFSVGGEVR